MEPQADKPSPVEKFESMVTEDDFDGVDDFKSTVQEKIVILTAEYQLEGFVHISDDVAQHRRFSELFNAEDRRFLALTDVDVSHRFEPTTPRNYQFLELNMSNILMVHPSVQSTGMKEVSPVGYSNQERSKSTPVEVSIVTDTHEVTGNVYVQRETKETRRLSSILNDFTRRFLALTNVKIVGRADDAVPRQYAFFLLSVESVQLISPTGHVELTKYSPQQGEKFDRFRHKLNQADPFGIVDASL